MGSAAPVSLSATPPAASESASLHALARGALHNQLVAQAQNENELTGGAVLPGVGGEEESEEEAEDGEALAEMFDGHESEDL